MRTRKTPEQLCIASLRREIVKVCAERNAARAETAKRVAEVREEEYTWRLKTMLAAEALRSSNVEVTGSPALSASPCGLPGYDADGGKQGATGQARDCAGGVGVHRKQF